MRANFVVAGVTAGIRRNLTMTIALVLSTAITLAFTGAAILASTEISKFKTDYEGKLNVSVFLCTKQHSARCHHETNQNDRDRLQKELDADPRVSSATYVSEQEQYNRFVRTQPSDIREHTRVGDLPASFTIKLKDLRRDADQFLADYRTKAGISLVTNQQDVLNRLLDVIDGVRLFAILIAVVVLIASILLISNTIQVAAAQRRNETSIMRLVGASRWMTELPFMLETVIATVIGGLIAAGMVYFGKYFVLNNVFQVQTANGVIPNLDTNDVLIATGIGLISGIVLSALTAFATLRLYVKL